MRVRFNEKKATQLAAQVLKEFGGTMDLLDLMKVIYCVDRAALVKFRWPLTGDRYSALPRGMVLSRTYDLAKDEGFEYPTFWDEHISKGQAFSLSLKADPGRDELSDAELELVAAQLAELKDATRQELIEKIHHTFPEWKDPQGSSFSVMYETVLEKEGWRAEEIDSLKTQMEVHSQFECAL